jgi:two-component system NtrC family sensor kinase
MINKNFNFLKIFFVTFTPMFLGTSSLIFFLVSYYKLTNFPTSLIMITCLSFSFLASFACSYFLNKSHQKFYTHINRLKNDLELANQKIVHNAKLSCMGEQLNGILHDIGNPLTVVLGKSTLLSKESYLERNSIEKIATSSMQILKAAESIDKMLKKVGEFGRSQLDYKNGISLNCIIETSLLFTKNKQKQFDVEVVNLLPKDFPTCFGDQGSLEQVFTNLISNACDALHNIQNPLITIQGQFDTNTVSIAIIDNGVGISKNDISKIFKPYYTSKSLGHGTGLGLSNSLQIVSNHKGQIECFSKPDIGSTFTVKLKRRREAPDLISDFNKTAA